MGQDIKIWNLEFWSRVEIYETEAEVTPWRGELCDRKIQIWLDQVE